MYRIVKGLSGSHRSTVSPQRGIWKKAYGIYSTASAPGAIGFYGEQQIPDMIEALYAEVWDEAFNLQERFCMVQGEQLHQRHLSRTAPSLPTTTPVKRAPSPPSRP